MIINLISKIFDNKEKSFNQALNYEQEHGGEIIEIDKNREWFVAISGIKINDIKEDASIVLVLFQKQKISIIATAKIIYYKQKEELFIADLESHIEDIGYGSILLRNIINAGKRLNCKVITGKLSSVDYGHFDKLKHFYEKFKFKVKISGKSGTIIRKLY